MMSEFKDARAQIQVKYPFADMPSPASLGLFPGRAPAPGTQECFALWDKYEMLENVRGHSLVVARIATALAERARQLGIVDLVDLARASALLHDLAKTFCVKYGGDHAMLGAAWAVMETGNYALAQGIILHVHWPWKLPENRDICCVPIFVLYADKRVRHDQCVSLDERFEDLYKRYGKTEEAILGIRGSHEQAKAIEEALSECLMRDLHEDNFDCGRLVQ